MNNSPKRRKHTDIIVPLIRADRFLISQINFARSMQLRTSDSENRFHAYVSHYIRLKSIFLRKYLKKQFIKKNLHGSSPYYMYVNKTDIHLTDL